MDKDLLSAVMHWSCAPTLLACYVAQWALVFTVGFLIGCFVGFLNPWLSSGIDIDFDMTVQQVVHYTVVMFHIHHLHSLIFILHNTM